MSVAKDDNVLDLSADDERHTRSGVFRRVMARDLHELDKRVRSLEKQGSGIFASPGGLLPYIAIAVVFVIILLGTVLYFDDRVADLTHIHGDDSQAVLAQLETQQRELDQLRFAVELARHTSAQSRALVAQTDRSRSAADRPNSAAEKTVPRARTPIGEGLQPGQALLIVASTVSLEEAMAQARRLENDGHESEIILGTSGYYGVALGRFSFEQAQSTKKFVTESGVESPSSYIMEAASIRSYVYP